MKPVNGFKSEPAKTSYPMLEAGPYIAAIQAVKLEGEEPTQTLILRVEITEGPAAGYFHKRYEHDSLPGGQFKAKYKGDFRIRIPNEDDPTDGYPETTLKRFNDAIYRIETSNPGYYWDWNENGLIGKAVGINMQEGTYNDSPFTVIGRLETVGDIRNGLVKPMKPRKAKYADDYIGGNSGSGAGAGSDSSGFTPVETEELPF